jgi:hypothetical protein
MQMKAYLLGKLGSSEADALEDRYFSDRKVLLQLKACEDDLIAGYLSGRLSADDRQLFEQRYLVIPELRQRVDDASRQQTRRALGNKWAARQMVFVAMVLLVSVGVWTYRESRAPAVIRSSGSRAIIPALVVPLSPGVVKGQSGVAEVRMPASRGTIRFLLDAPGTQPFREVFAGLFLIGSSGERTRVWQSNTPLASIGTGVEVRFAANIDSAILRRGDYLLSLESKSGEALDNYLFWVADSR